MRLIFFGTGSFALPALAKLAGSVNLVVSQPDRPKGRGLKLQPSSVKLMAQQLGIPVHTPDRARAPEFVQFIRDVGADALVVASYGQILSQALLDAANRGGINLHGSILPEYRGAAPIQRAILDGRAETGVSIMQMDRGMDTGGVIDLRTLPILADETYSELQIRLAELAGEMAETWLPKIVTGEYRPVPQDGTRASYAPKIEKLEAQVDFSGLPLQEYNRIRAFTDSPGAYLQTRLGVVRVHKARLGQLSGQPGQILSTKGLLAVGIGPGSIDFIELQPEGKKRMAARDFANGARLSVGDSLMC